MTSAEQIELLDAALSPFPVDYAFIGGGVLSLLVSDVTAEAVRVTMDIDVLTGTTTRKAWQGLEGPLSEKGFCHDMSEGAPVCRWKYGDTTVDILPIHRSVLGWDSKWFAEALAAARPVPVGERMARVVTAPYFLALKAEAFESRGRKDMLTSRDFEDILCLLDGRPEIVEEVRAERDDLRRYLSERLAEYLGMPDLESAVEGFVWTEVAAESRRVALFSRIREIAMEGKTH